MADRIFWAVSQVGKATFIEIILNLDRLSAYKTVAGERSVFFSLQGIFQNA